MAYEKERDRQLLQLVHDVRHCLHVIGMAAELLKEVRGDEERFSELCASIDHERREAADLVKHLLDLARQTE